MKKIRKYRKTIIRIIDLIIVISSCFIYCFFTSAEHAITEQEIIFLIPHIVILLLCIFLGQSILKTYDNIWRYAQSNEYVRLMMGLVFGFFVYTLINQIIFRSKTAILFSIAVCAIANFFMLIIRFFYRMRVIKIQKKKIPLAIIGAGNAGVHLMEEIQYNPKSDYKIYCFFDDNTEKIGKKVRGISVLGPIDQFVYLVENTPIKEAIIAIPSLTNTEKSEMLKNISKANIRVQLLPDLLSVLQNSENGLLSSVRELNVDDLLEREAVCFDKKEIDNFLKNKIIIVTGGGGSIGSEICRQIAKSNPAQLIIIDFYENNAYDIQQELIYKYKDKLNLAVEIASVEDKDKIEKLFERYQPHIVFHTAAHKHVPFMEDCPDEAIKNNIFGTYNIVQAANRWKAQKFVLISTDKAVNPTSMMGASKRMCEMIIQSMKNISKTEYTAVRFGNVLGSNGSVIPLFKRQIEQGGPVTITNKRVYRYFMTIPEAAQLVLRAGAITSNSQIYVLDMGKPVNILMLAENLIRLLGYVPYTEIPIMEIGMRPGEKYNEELIMGEEELVKTVNRKIYVESQKEITPKEIEQRLEILKTALETQDQSVIRQSLIDIIPTFQVRN
jgi:FlaA1/EpsC-like NDP-sugar epimerase